MIQTVIVRVLIIIMIAVCFDKNHQDKRLVFYILVHKKKGKCVHEQTRE